MTRALSAAEVLDLPAAVDLITAGRALGLARTTAYELARRGEFPVPLLRLGRQYRARRSDLLDLLGIQDRATAPTEPIPHVA
jgi:predicted DNA-binding transcriptional regulator AlpA